MAKQTTPRVDRHLVTLTSTHSFEAEQYRRLCERLEVESDGRRRRVIAISSPAAGEGKTVTAINLAVALASGRERRVLLVDADTRRPSIAAKLGLAPQTTDFAALLGDPGVPWRSAVRPVLRGRLDVLPCYASRSDAHELLRSPALGTLIAEAREAYHYVIVDTPPLIPVPDGSVIARIVDGVVIVVSSHRTPRRLLGEALNLVEPSAVVGLVLNRDEQPLFGYYHASGREYFDGYLQALTRQRPA